MSLSIDAEKSFHQIQYTFIKTKENKNKFQGTRNRKKHLQPDKEVLYKYQHLPIDKIVNAFLLRLEKCNDLI